MGTKIEVVSDTGTRTRVCPVKAGHPSHLDYIGVEKAPRQTNKEGLQCSSLSYLYLMLYFAIIIFASALFPLPPFSASALLSKMSVPPSPPPLLGILFCKFHVLAWWTLSGLSFPNIMHDSVSVGWWLTTAPNAWISDTSNSVTKELQKYKELGRSGRIVLVKRKA